ncbi:bacteriocin microcin [Salmonella enterica subsp. enterica]|nr:bacteriocin microcin [Salmonella sp. 32020501-2019-00050]EBB6210444.1 bacteriocin microcin [Salmonella enterica]EBZ4664649.1 bacteriocin microcin [Salmonella enterica subsp. enterica serovar Bovismorbificans]ECH8735075.1 bacteriocin microcin [Salmonella enterica subsp. enterica serovar Wandsworth]EEJ2306808.1 bacteriocin microcin [Salmonella enterica subsp. enterica]EDS5037830.1 bacteriocin microcin [Salmonella enterica subsp. enterica serovar Wandsworth]
MKLSTSEFGVILSVDTLKQYPQTPLGGGGGCGGCGGCSGSGGSGGSSAANKNTVPVVNRIFD